METLSGPSKTTAFIVASPIFLLDLDSSAQICSQNGLFDVLEDGFLTIQPGFQVKERKLT